LKAVHHIFVSSAETRRAFSSGFDTVNLQGLTLSAFTSLAKVSIIFGTEV
jgi:hypothetical protein